MAVTYHAGRRIQGLSTDTIPSATYSTDFSSSTDWTQTGSNITINTGTNSLTWIGDRTASSHGLHHDLGSGTVSSKWVLEFDFVLDNYSAGTASFTHQIGVMLTDVDSTSGTYGSDATRNFIGMRLNWRTDTASQQRKFYIIDDNGGTDTWADNVPANTPDDSTAQSFPTAGTTYHMKLIKDGGSHSLEIWNSSQTSLLDTLNGSNSTTADIRYILVQSYNGSTDGNPSFDGKIQNMKFYNGVTLVTSKPTDVQIGSRFEETDTRKMYNLKEQPTPESTATYQVTDASGTQGLYTGSYYISAEKVKSTSVLVGKRVSKLQMTMYKSNSPTGTATAGVWNSSGELQYTFGTIDVSTLATSFTEYTFNNTDSTHVFSADEYFGIKYQAGSNTNKIIVGHDDASPPFDGTNSVWSRYNGSWSDFDNVDNTFKLYLATAGGTFTWQEIGA